MSGDERDTIQLADDIRRGVDELQAAIDKLPTKSDWTDATISAVFFSVAATLVAALVLFLLRRFT